jgi:hypothetical protein
MKESESKMKRSEGHTRMAGSGPNYRPLFCLLPFAFFLLVSCADTNGSRPKTFHERQDDALRDPFNYGPTYNRSNDAPNVSSGGIGDFDRKGFDRDLQRVLGGP